MVLGRSRTLTPVCDLIGRDAAKSRLLKVFKEAGRGYGKVVLVPGQSGIGKTSLVHWLETPVEKEDGIFVTGKFNQYHQNTPYYAIRQALGRLWNLLSASRNASGIVEEVREALGNLRGLLIRLVPEIGDAFDDDPEVDDSSINFIEARHRFATVVTTFLKTVSRPEHPVVIFIDDWQWADSASLELLKGLHGASEIGFCLVIASYRDEEVDETHPLTPVIADLNRRPQPPEVLPVERLNREAVREMISCALEGEVDRLEDFTRRIGDHTKGNPFHIKSFLGFLNRTGLLWFDDEDQTWFWHLEEDMPGDIVAIFVRHLDRFSSEERALITLAACIGNFFDLKTLCLISRRTEDDCLKVMAPLVSDGLVLETPGENPLGSGPAFMFLHDRVQQAAYQMIPREKRPSVHLETGRLLLAGLREDEIPSRLFEILEHLNTGGDLINEPLEQRRMVELNMAAAAKARSATAFSAMLMFNRFAYAFACRMPGGMAQLWETGYDKALALCRGLGESEFLEGDRQRAESIIQGSLTYTRTAIERGESLNILIVHYTLSARYDEAILSGRQALSEFGIILPDKAFEVHRDREMDRVKELLADREVAQISRQPVMTDPEMLMVTKLLITLGPPCYRTHQQLWSVIVPKVVNITLEFGLVPQVGYSYTAYGGLLCWVKGDYGLAREFGAVSEAVMETIFDAPSDLSVFYLMVGSSIRHWFKPLKEASTDYARAFESGRQSGNLQYAAYAFGHDMYCRFFRGMPLAELVASTEQSLVFSRTRLNHWAIDLLEGGRSLFKALADEIPFAASIMNDGEYLDQVKGNKNIQVRCIYTVFKVFYNLLLGDNEQALSLSDEADSLIYTVGTQGLLPWPEHVFIRFLVMAALYDGADIRKKQEWLASLRESRQLMETWARQCPENYAHKSFLAGAELERIEQRPHAAAVLYDRAVAAARENEFVQWEGIANERAFWFWSGLGKGAVANIYWQQAYTCYRLWGASAKLTVMEEAFRVKLETWYPHRSCKEVNGKGFQDAVSEFSKKHIELLRVESGVNLELKQQQSQSRVAEELAEAIKRLRVESAERKLAEAELKKTMEENRQYIRQLEQKNQELDEFTYIASHDLQEPLRKLTAFSKLLIKDLSEEMNDNARKDLEYITDAAGRMEVLIQDLLELSRAGRGSITRERLSLNQCFAEVETLLQLPLQESGAELIRADLPEVRGDKVLLGLVFQNLIQNALKFSDKEPPRIEVTCTPGRDGPVIGIKDNGIGIEPRYAAQIFQPFKRLHGRNEYPGTGIGLAICRKVVERHNGTIWVESVPGEYSHFQFTLNNREENAVESETSDSDSAGGR